MPEETAWVPQFEGQRPPFQPGNQYRFTPGHPYRFSEGNEHRVGEGNELATRHGAYSPRRVDPLATSLVEQLLADDVAYLRAAKWGPAVWGWARCEARVQLVTEYLIEVVGAGRLGDLDDPRVAAAYKLLDRFEAQPVQQRGRLG